MSNQVSFTHELIKGKIAEIIFEMMFRETDKFTVLRFGYEYTEPILAQYQHKLLMKKVLDGIRNAPDFILMTNAKKGLYIIEVKYRQTIYAKDIYEIADKMLKNWNPSHLFIISSDGFYFGPANKIINNNGKIDRLSTDFVNTELQKRYFELASHFLHRHEKE